MGKDILLETENGPVVTLTLNAPERLNPLSDAMLGALSEALERIAVSKTTRVVVIEGAGKAFCAGHDLREMTAARQATDGGHAAFLDLFERCSAVMQRLQTLPQPVIASVHGIATAAGCQLVATSDLAVAGASTRFGVNGVNIGLFCSTPMVALSRAMPRKKVFEMLVTGDMIPADAALEAGLINRVVPDDELKAATEALAQEIAGKLGAAVRIGKRAFYEQLQMPLDQAYAHTGQVMAANMAVSDTEEGIAAFLEKRPPAWQT